MRETAADKFSFQPFFDFPEKWALLTAGNAAKFNSMTVSWGFAGELWGKNCVAVFVRPQRYTFEFCESNDYFSLSLMPEGFKKQLSVFGSKSGREYDKYAATGLTAVTEGLCPYCGEAQTVLICRKIAQTDMKPEWFLEKNIIPDCYPNSDYHRMYIGEVVKVLCENK